MYFNLVISVLKLSISSINVYFVITVVISILKTILYYLYILNQIVFFTLDISTGSNGYHKNTDISQVISLYSLSVFTFIISACIVMITIFSLITVSLQIS